MKDLEHQLFQGLQAFVSLYKQKFFSVWDLGDFLLKFNPFG